MKRSLLFFLFIICCGVAFAQNATLFGTVKDSLNHPVYGASIAVYGKPYGTTTDESGKYSLTVPANEPLKIIFSFTGLQRDSVNLTLKPNEKREANKSLH